MKKTKKIISIVLSVLMIAGIYAAMPAYAQEIPSDILMERRAEKALFAVEKRSQKIASGPIKRVSTNAELVAAVEAKETNIYLLQDIYLEEALQIDYDVFFLADSQGKTIYAKAGINHIQITANGVQLQFDNVILDGNYNEENKKTYFGGINADDITDITLVGLNIQNCKGLAISNSLSANMESSFSLYNCILKNNLSECADTFATNILLYNVLCENNGGGVLLGAMDAEPYEDTIISNVSLYNVTIRNNQESGISLYNANAFLNSDTIIENNVSEFGGAGINAEKSNIESYATINKNVTKWHGGGILLRNSSATIQGGEISYNRACTQVLSSYNFGGGIAIELDSEEPNENLIINDCIMEGNIAAYGGAIGSGSWSGMLPSYIIINGGTIRNSGNQVAEISDYNYVCECGGGIYADKVKMTGGTIEQNHSLSRGAGIFANEFIMNGGTIQDNGYFLSENGDTVIQTSQGGGVYAEKSAVITDGLIYSNMARYGGGIYVFDSLELSAPAYIRYNTAENQGGGVYYKPANSQVDFSRIRNNTAPQGPDYYPL